MIVGMARVLSTHLTAEPERVPDALFSAVVRVTEAMDGVLAVLPAEPGGRRTLLQPGWAERYGRAGDGEALQLDSEWAAALGADALAMRPDLWDTISWVIGNASRLDADRYVTPCNHVVSTLESQLLEPIFDQYPELRPPDPGEVARVLRWD